MTDEVKVGLIGCGRHGLGVLAPALKAVEGAKLVACADGDEVAAQRGQERLRLDRVHVDYQAMLDGEDLDAVIVAVPHHLLKDISVAVAESGRHDGGVPRIARHTFCCSRCMTLASADDS